MDKETSVGTREKVTITPVPLKSVPDWKALAEIAKLQGRIVIAPDTEANAAHASLHRAGMGLYAVYAGSVRMPR